MLKKYCFIQKVKPEAKDEYCKLHKSAGRELCEAIARSGVVNEYLFVFDETVIVIFETDDLLSAMKKMGDNEVIGKWSELVRPMLSEYPDFYGESGIESFAVDKIFDLRQQLSGKLENF